MNIREYAKYDATDLAELVRKKQVSPKELALTAAKAIEKANPEIKGVVEIYDEAEGASSEDVGLAAFLVPAETGSHDRERHIGVAVMFARQAQYRLDVAVDIADEEMLDQYRQWLTRLEIADLLVVMMTQRVFAAAEDHQPAALF